MSGVTSGLALSWVQIASSSHLFYALNGGFIAGVISWAYYLNRDDRRRLASLNSRVPYYEKISHEESIAGQLEARLRGQCEKRVHIAIGLVSISVQAVSVVLRSKIRGTEKALPQFLNWFVWVWCCEVLLFLFYWLVELVPRDRTPYLSKRE